MSYNIWSVELLLLSPKEEREWWLAELTRREPYGMAVNCKHMPCLEKTPALLRLIEEGKILRIRMPASWGNSFHRRTVLRLPTQE